MPSIGHAHGPGPRAGEGQGPRKGIDTVASLVLPADSPFKREPTRPLDMRDADFNERFDDNTLVFDAIRSADRATLRLLCPSFFNLRPAMEKATFRAQPSGAKCLFRFRPLDRHDQVFVELPAGTEAVTLEAEFGTFPLEFRDESLDAFAGQRVVFTRSKNNRPEWILDWARFYRDVHGATAVLLYDNASTDYSSGDLLDALKSVNGLETVVVVEWPFKYGVAGKGKSRRYWDSDFSQLGSFEDAHWRYLGAARSALNCDVDELILSTNGRSVFEQAERSLFGVVSFTGDWVFGIEGVTRQATVEEPMRFRDYRHTLQPIREMKFGFLPTYPMRCAPKWAIVPSRCPANTQWNNHAIKGWPASRIRSSTLRFAHFREISTSWKYDRSSREKLDPRRHREDALLLDALQRVDWAA